jgi:uncharacterized MnhB-related membrane protein
MIASDVLIAQNVGFAIIAALMIFGALRVVTTNNVVHAALWLVVVLAGAAAQYILLAAEFVAVTQVMVYIGAHWRRKRFEQQELVHWSSSSWIVVGNYFGCSQGWLWQ